MCIAHVVEVVAIVSSQVGTIRYISKLLFLDTLDNFIMHLEPNMLTIQCNKKVFFYVATTKLFFRLCDNDHIY